MIVCPNCNHQNPDAAIQCEACYTPLPAMTTCPSCGASVQTDASFCGQCGSNLQGEPVSVNPVQSDPALSKQAPLPTLSPDLDIPDLPPIEPLVPPDPLLANPTMSGAENPPQPVPVPSPVASQPIEPIASSPSLNSRTQLQTHAARLLHVQTDRLLELPANLSVIHLGKPNDRIPPDIDVSGFPNSEIVSRIHADIRVEGDIYYIEDVGSSNGTYVNNTPLPPGNRHRLRSGDRIALGKGDKVTFLFQMT